MTGLVYCGLPFSSETCAIQIVTILVYWSLENEKVSWEKLENGKMSYLQIMYNLYL